MDFDSPWDEDTSTVRDAEWSKISSDFHNVGYREGITAGEESALQEGFDDGFANTGAPLGRQIGILRGVASALLSLLTSSTPVLLVDKEPLIQEARGIAAGLAEIRFSDIAPPDLEAERHAREHLELSDYGGDPMNVDVGESLTEKREVEGLEDMMTRLGAGSISSAPPKDRPTMEDMKKLSLRLDALSSQLGLALSSFLPRS